MPNVSRIRNNGARYSNRTQVACSSGTRIACAPPSELPSAPERRLCRDSFEVEGSAARLDRGKFTASRRCAINSPGVAQLTLILPSVKATNLLSISNILEKYIRIFG